MILGMLQLANILGDLFLNFELNTSYRASSRITVVITSKTQGNSWVISQQVLFFNAFKLGTRSKKNQIFSNEEALTSILAKSSTIKGISYKWVLEDPFSSLFGLLLSSKRFSGAIQSKFFSRASCIPTSLKGMGILNSSLGLVLSEIPTTFTLDPSILKRSKPFLASLATS